MSELITKIEWQDIQNIVRKEAAWHSAWHSMERDSVNLNLKNGNINIAVGNDFHREKIKYYKNCYLKLSHHPLDKSKWVIRLILNDDQQKFINPTEGNFHVNKFGFTR